ncbi:MULTISPECIES: hypothetical protein [Nostoc]|uniref:WD40 repeat domain-containing protein n=1 Tax=Nostoc paludosum FACHB-159 TaxID=2692908 RepID=A0ABR8KI32_9NOSO|nr:MULTISPECIES: hypothetical protein [Nostoc]MBD2681273.1 hypothetical protein [Nostoc sp. FACHB-857]MBD2737752.1 hypothetical protein [Nostoc paludosum FACHB-159]
MENRIINASLSSQSLTFKPGGSPAAFVVTVINDGEQFAAFQLEILAAGASRSSGSQWYRLTPEVAAAKPPGGVTEFKVEIFDAPIPAFVGTINLTVRIFSPQLREERKLLVRLIIQPGKISTLLSVELPVRRFQVYPRNSVEIPARVRNLSPIEVETVVRFEGLNSSWIIGSTERRLLLEPGGQEEISFLCQPPAMTQAPSDDYPFVVKASSRNSPAISVEGILEILPVGYVGFTVTPQKQTLPNHKKWLPDRKSKTALFELFFKNTSNLYQQVDVELQGRDRRRCTYQVVPENVDLTIGETTKALLNVTTKRPWVGLAKTLRLEARTLLADQRLGSTDPSTQTLDLKVLPIVPLWLFLALLALLAALILFLLIPEPIGHTDIVNSVRFSGDAFSVVSGSDDCTIRIWSVDGNRLNPKGTAASPVNRACNDKVPNPEGLLAVIGQPVRTLRFMPKDDDRIAAGLEDGEIQFWNVRTHDRENSLRDPNDQTSDRVFALVFTENSLNLFSGHGSGKLRLWKRSGPGTNFESNPQVTDLGKDLKYPIRALALSEDETILVTAGNFKRVILMNPNNLEDNQRQLSTPELNGGDGDYIWSLDFAPGSHILATSDSDGFISLWDLDKCQTPQTQTSVNNSLTQQQCELRDRWRAANTSVRSIAFTVDGNKLVSAGDDGKIVIWPLTAEQKLDRTQAPNGQVAYQGSSQINTIDVTKDVQGTIVVSGDDAFRVKLYR